MFMSGSYRRQIRCRYCGDKGHNIVGCQRLKDYVKQNPNSYYAERLKNRQESAKHRKCSYCSSEGHNRKTCHHIMEDMVKIADLNIHYRQKFIENIIERDGIAPGALVSVDKVSGYLQDGTYGYEHKDCVALVTNIVTDNVKYPSRARASNCIEVQFLNLFNSKGTNNSESVLSVPDWYVLGKDSTIHSPLRFKLVSRGFYHFDNQEQWTRNSEVIQKICSEDITTHSDFQYAMNYYVVE